MKEYPRVSVVVSTYNRGGDYLPLALQSIVNQDYTDFEVIVVDDASTDDTPNTLERFYKKFKERNIEFRAARLEKNSGYQCVPKNMGIFVAKGDYIAYLDDDNEWMATHLSTMMAEMEANIELDMVYCWRKYTGEGGLDIDPHPSDWPTASAIIMNFSNVIDTSDIIHSRGIAYALYDRYESIWDENDRRFGDLTLLRRLITVGCRAKLVKEELTLYRWHGNNLMLTRPIAKVVPTTIDKVNECESQSIQ